MAELMYDQFKLIEKKHINSDDINSLTKLYLPLMGIDSYSLYMALSSLDVNVNYNYKTLIDILNVRGMKSINSASNKLEALGLLDVYVNSDNNYLYILNRPMSQRDFLKEESLRTLLSSQIGEEAVLKLISEVTFELRRYKKITKKFDDVYDVTFEDKFYIIDKLIPSKFEIKNEEFNYSLFKMLFDTSFISEDVLEDSEFKSNILRISYIYKLDEEKMKDVVIRSIDIDKKMDYAVISKNAKLKFRERDEENDPIIITRENDEYLQSIKDDQTLALCNYLESLSPKEVLQELSGGKKPAAAEVKMCSDLSETTGLPIAIINLLLLYANQEKEGKLPGYEYFEKIAHSMVRAKIKNVNEALRFLAKKNATSRSYANKKQKVTLPDWYKTYSEELDNKLEKMKNTTVDGNEADILKEAKDLFGE